MEKKNEIPSVNEDILSHPYVQHLHAVIESLSKDVDSLNNEVSELKEYLQAYRKYPKNQRSNPVLWMKSQKIAASPKPVSAQAAKNGKRKKTYQ